MNNKISVLVVLLYIKVAKMTVIAYDTSYFSTFGRWPGFSRPLVSMRNQQSISYRCYFPIEWRNCFFTPNDNVFATSYLNAETGIKQSRNIQQLNGLIYQSNRNFNLVGKLQPYISMYDSPNFTLRPFKSIHSHIPYNRRKLLDANKNKLLLSLAASTPSYILPKNGSIIQTSNRTFIAAPTSKKLLPSNYTSETNVKTNKMLLLSEFNKALDKLERKFYMVTFLKLSSISPVERRENGISFVQSALFLQLLLMTISTEVNSSTKTEIDDSIGLHITDADKIDLIKEIIATLPSTDMDLVFRWQSRLAVGANQNVSGQFTNGAAAALQLHLVHFNVSESPQTLAQKLNRMVEEDSKGAMHDTFEEDEFSEGLRALAMNTVYFRARWRSAPTVLNGSRQFRDADAAPSRTVRMIRINDIMRYGDLPECNAEAVEVSYATPGLSLLVLVPRGKSLRKLADHIVANTLHDITEKMITMRVAATLPLYTLRMTLLLPSKLQTMGISRIFNSTDTAQLKLSHGVQRLMFWAEAGRNAFKDDGIEWEEVPEYEIVVDRPYMFFVRWRNMTLMNGNFVL
ncbi:leukocyte elastase inhibitor-like [Achroia grisella]|uniref:leukocyte elastase inhibitor-like n=1 Tax=Achroia grisella TaxID=688607 RepID=UPI0027D3053E|nr:leukocyte elastase inhibitor-like [Achroia grisella]